MRQKTKSEGAPAEPIRTDATRLLAEKQAALAQAGSDLTAAREACDERRVMDAQQRIVALRAIIDDLTARHHRELEDVSLARARDWIDAESLDDIARDVQRCQNRAHDAVEAAVAAIAAEAQARRRWAAVRAGTEALAIRWPEVVSESRPTVSIPGALDYTSRVAVAAADVRDIFQRPLVVPGATASSTPQERRRRSLRALFQLIDRPKKRGGSRVPEDVAAIIASAPRPPEIAETTEERERRERAEARHERESARIDEAITSARRAFGGIPGGHGLSEL